MVELLNNEKPSLCACNMSLVCVSSSGRKPEMKRGCIFISQKWVVTGKIKKKQCVKVSNEQYKGSKSLCIVQYEKKVQFKAKLYEITYFF